MYIDSFMFGGGFEIMFTLIFITVFGLIIFTIIRGSVLMSAATLITTPVILQALMALI